MSAQRKALFSDTARIFGLLLIVFLLKPLAGAAAADHAAAAMLEELTAEAGVVFQDAADFRDIEPAANPVLPYERAVRHQSEELEVRYAIRPLGRVQIEYDDPHSAAPEPNHLYPLMFTSITDRLSTGRHSPSQEYSADQAREKFNADWAAAAAFDVDPEFSADYKEGLLVALHKNNKADVYVVYLYNDYARIKTYLEGAMSALVFSD